MNEAPKNPAASVKARLQNKAAQLGDDFNLLLLRFGIERLLFRLSKSVHAEQFVLKGAMLFLVWDDKAHRPTRDLDLLGFGPTEKEDLNKIFREVATQAVVDDGLVFDPASVQSENIREDNAYGGIRIRMMATLGKAEVPIQIDVGVGDAITPAPETTSFPALLDFPAPRVRTYPVYTVVAEKFEAMVKLGIANTRMKDFHDVWFLTRRFPLDKSILRSAIEATFARRRTDLPIWPGPLSDAFAEDPTRQIQWAAFIRRNSLTGIPGQFAEICYEIRQHPQLRHLPVIIYTATYTAPSDERLSLDFGADRFLRKPATTDDLIRAMREILAKSDRGEPVVRASLDQLGRMQQYSQGLVDKLALKNLQLEAQAIALRLSERWSRLVFDAANDATFLIQLDPNGIPGRIIGANEAASELLGYTQEELLARTVRELEPTEDEASLGPLAARVHAEKRLVFERRLVAKNGRLIPVELSVRSVPSELGLLAIAAARDITERKKAEAERNAHEQRLRAILDSLFAFVGLLSLDGTLLEVNRAPLEAAGIGCEDVIDKPFYQTFWWSYSAEIQALLKDAIARAARGETVRFDVVVRMADGRQMPVDCSVNPLRDETGRVRQLVACGVDITERKKLEQQFLRAQRVEAIGTLASGIAHDLNNILAPMLMGAGLIKDKLTSPRDQAVARIIETGAQRGAAVIRQLLTFSRGSEEPRGAVQVRHLINDMVHLARETFPRNIKIEWNAPGDLWLVNADATQLHQVLMNLCVNARDAMPKGGTLSVGSENFSMMDAGARLSPLAKPGPYVVISVTDTGEGIPQEIIDRIFDPYFTTKPVGQGTGLGLSTVLAIARNHGGFVTVDSEPGHGTAFRVYLPAVQGAVAETKDDQGTAPRGNGEQLLLVDDEEPIRRATQHVLEEHGYRVLTAANGEEGVRLFVQHRETARLVIADLMMPVMDGIDMIRSLRIADNRIQIIATSGLDEISRRTELSALGVNEVLIKPCEPTLLLRTIHRLISGSNRPSP